MYDVLVIGAGPAGCTAAKVLSGKGMHVLLVERHRLPRYKSCSGILIKKSMDLVRLYFGARTPPAALCTPYENRGMVLTNDKGKEYRFEQEGLNVWRSSFDHWLARQAVDSGVQLQDGTNACSCSQQPGSVSVVLRGEKAYEVEAAYVLDCGGATGPVKRKAIGCSRDFIMTYQTFNKGSIGLDPHYFYAYLQPELSEYDAWFNVKDDMLVLGVAAKDASKVKFDFYYSNFVEYMKRQHGLCIDSQIRAEKWLMPRIRPGCPVAYGMGRMLYAGETAGFLNPMGEGISAAMESGYHAACALAQYFKDPAQVCAAYQQAAAPLKSYMERQWSLTAGMAGTFAEMG